MKSFVVAAFVAVLTASSLPATVSAMPIAPVASVLDQSVQVRWVCDYYGRCWWQRPRVVPYPYAGAPIYGRYGHGYHRHHRPYYRW